MSIAAVLVIGLLFPAPVKAEEVKVSVDTSRGFARILFETSSIIGYEARVENAVLVIKFERPLDADFNDLIQPLSSYVARFRKDDDGKTMRFALTGKFRMQTSHADMHVAVDLLPVGLRSAPKGIEPEISEEDLAAREEMERQAEIDANSLPIEIRPLDVRVSRSEKYSRLSFDWQERVGYEAVLENGTTRINFSRAGDPEIAELRVDLPKFIKSVEKSIEGDMLKVTMRIEPDAGMRHFRDGNSIIIDILDPEEARLVGDARGALGEVDEADYTETEPEETTEVKQARLSELQESNNAEKEVQVAKAAAKEKAAQEQAAYPLKTDANPQRDFASSGDTGITSVELARLEEAAIEQSGIHNRKLKVTAFEAKNSLKIVFGWGSDVPAAIFRRGDNLWVVFDKQNAALDLSVLGREQSEFISSKSSGSTKHAQFVKLKLARNFLISAQYKRGAWIVTVGPSIEQPSRLLNLTRGKNHLGHPKVMVPLEEIGAVHWLRDTDIGDEIAVVTALAPIRGLVSLTQMVEFKALGSVHGLVVLPLVDDLVVKKTADAVAIERDQGLTISAVQGLEEFVEKTPLGGTREPAFVDIQNWQLAPFKDFASTEQDLHLALARAELAEDVATVNDVQMKLARFYLAHDFAAEALGVLTLIERANETAQLDPVFKALRGVSYYMNRQYEEALKDLTDGSLTDDPHGALWRGLAYTGLGSFEDGHREFERGLGVIPRYTPILQGRMRIGAANAAFGVHDVDRVEMHVSDAASGDLPVEILAEGEMVRGRMLESVGKVGEALQHYQRVIQVGSPDLVAEATLAKTFLLNHLGQISNEEAIEKLDVLRFQWRGDDLELSILHRLGEMYVAKGDFRHGLGMMQEVLANYPDSRVANEIADSMSGIFKRLFLDESIEDLPPVQALALYYEFRHLTPIGREGDEMLRKLVDRLVSFDLLEQAAELLEHQVDERLKGVARAQVATRLAVVYLSDRQPEKALQTIHKTRQTRLPKTLNYARRLLEARALAELGRYAHALELVQEYDSADVKQLRSDVAWRGQDWPNAGRLLETQLGVRWKTKAALDESERSKVLRTVVAYALSEDKKSLDRLRKKFLTHMSQSRDAAAFDVITQDIDTSNVAFTELATKIATVDTLEDFMKSFATTFKTSEGAIN